MKAEMDRFAREKKELSEQIESQLEWFRSERDDEISKLTAEKKVLQDRLHDAESQISQLKCRKRDELKVLFIFYFSPFCSIIFFACYGSHIKKRNCRSTIKIVIT